MCDALLKLLSVERGSRYVGPNPEIGLELHEVPCNLLGLFDLTASCQDRRQSAQVEANAVVARDGSVDLARWNEVPILTRAEVTQSFAQMRAINLDESQLGPVSEHKTSGSDGEAIMFGVNGLAKVAYNAAIPPEYFDFIVVALFLLLIVIVLRTFDFFFDVVSMVIRIVSVSWRDSVDFD